MGLFHIKIRMIRRDKHTALAGKGVSSGHDHHEDLLFGKSSSTVMMASATKKSFNCGNLILWTLASSFRFIGETIFFAFASKFLLWVM